MSYAKMQERQFQFQDRMHSFVQRHLKVVSVLLIALACFGGWTIWHEGVFILRPEQRNVAGYVILSIALGVIAVFSWFYMRDDERRQRKNVEK